MSWLLSINPWLVLVVAGLFEVGWASGVKYVGVQRPLISLGVAVALAASMVGLWAATQKLPVGTAYAVWAGVGASVAVIYSFAAGHEAATVWKVLFLAMIIGGIVGLKAVS